jgi:hypothetical protein
MNRDAVVRAFTLNGGMTANMLIINYGLFEYENSAELKEELNILVSYGKLRKGGNYYFPTNNIEKLATGENIVPPREPVPFTPLKSVLPKVSPRGQPIEQRSFFTCTSAIKQPYQDILFRNANLSRV